MNKALWIIFLVMLITHDTGLSQESINNRLIYQNLALQSSVAVSSVGEPGLTGKKASDGDTLTRWSSAPSDNEWIQFDLKKEYPVDRVILKWEVAYASEYTLQSSADGKIWADAFAEKNGDGKTDDILLQSLYTRYLRLFCLKRNTRYGSSLWEMEVYSFQYPVSYRDNFADTVLTGWSNTLDHHLKQEDNALRIDKNPDYPYRFSGIFTLTLPEQIPMHDFPFISFKSKAYEKLKMTLWLNYQGNILDTFTCSLNSDSRWHIYSFNLNPSRQESLKNIDFQLITGGLKDDTVTVYLDDVTIGYQGKTQEIDKSILQKLVSNAEKYLWSALQENISRQFPANALIRYKDEIREATEILNTQDLSQIEIDKAVNRLIMANAAIESSVMGLSLSMKTCNPDATLETRFLYNNMKQVEGKAIFFGQMDPFILNTKPTGKPFQSDVEDICGSLPAVGSWELKDICLGLSYEKILVEAEYYYSRNGILSFCWHMMDPAGSGFYLKDVVDKSAGNELLPGGKHHTWFLGQLDRIAFVFQQMKGPGGESVPILFRPFHEMDGDWFWWGKPYVSPQTFAKIWQFTFNYLVSVKKVNNLLFVFSPCDRFKTREGGMGYLDYYPGDDYVDILAQDNYWQVRTGADSAAFLNQLRIMTILAAEKNKISGLSETGLAGLTIPDWFTSVLLNPVKNDSLARKITYMAIWNKAFVPYPGHPAAPDFMRFYNDPVTLFIGDYPDLYHSLIKN